METERNGEIQELRLPDIFSLDHNRNARNESGACRFEYTLVETRGHPVVISGDDELRARHTIFSLRRT